MPSPPFKSGPLSRRAALAFQDITTKRAFMSVIRSPLYSPLRSPLRSPLALLKGGGVAVGPTWGEWIADLDGTQVLDIDFERTDRHWQDVAGATLADDAGENIALAFDQSQDDGRGIVNQLVYSDDFANASWTKNSVSVAVVADSDGEADLVYPASTGTGSQIRRLFGSVSSVVVTNSISAKAAGKNWLYVYNAQGNVAAWFNLATGAVGTVGGGVTAAIADDGGGYWRCSVTATVTYRGYFVGVADGNGSTSVTASGIDGVYVRAAQQEFGALTAYQPNGATVGGPGEHGIQTLSNLQGKRQAGGVCHYDGSDDNHLTTFLAQNGANTMIYHGTVAASIAATQMPLGASGSGANRCWLAITTAGYIAAGVGSQSSATIVGTTDVRGKEIVAAVTFDGSTVKLFLLVDGVTTEEYSAAQDSTPTTSIPFRIGAYNNNGTAAGFAQIDAKSLKAAHKSMSLAEFTSIAADLAA